MATSLVVSPGAKTMLEGTATASEAKLPSRNPPGSSTDTPTISSLAVLLPLVRVKVAVSPSVMLVSSTERVMVGRSSSSIVASFTEISSSRSEIVEGRRRPVLKKSSVSYTESSKVATVSVSVWVTYSTNRSVMGTAGNTTSCTWSVGLVPSAMRRLGSQVRTSTT